jgi:hypothetical protein
VRAQNLRDGVGLFVCEAEDRAGLVRIVGGVQDDVEIAAAPRDDADPVTLMADEFVSETDARQQDLLDIHRSQSLTKRRPNNSDTGQPHKRSK